MNLLLSKQNFAIPVCLGNFFHHLKKKKKKKKKQLLWNKLKILNYKYKN